MARADAWRIVVAPVERQTKRLAANLRKRFAANGWCDRYPSGGRKPLRFAGRLEYRFWQPPADSLDR
jgi:hypothetical protein